MRSDKYIFAWGVHRCISGYQIAETTRQAAIDGAPETALYKDDRTGKWIVLEDLGDTFIRGLIERIASGL